MALAGRLVTHLPPGRADGVPLPELERALARLLDDARAAWPALSVDDEALLRRIAEALPGDDDLLAAIRTTYAGDLLLATACAAGDPQALAALEQRFLAPLARAGDAGDEVLQQLRVKLLVADGEARAPRIAACHGRGPLAGWLAVTAARIAVDLQRPERRLDRMGDVVDRIAAASVDPELGYLKARYGRELADALRAPLAALPVRDTNVLRLHVAERMTAEALARMYGVSRRTVHRWLATVQAELVTETRRLLGERLRVAPEELESLFALVSSQVAVSLELGVPDDEP